MDKERLSQEWTLIN